MNNKKDSLQETIFSFNLSLGLKFIGIAFIALIFLMFPIFFDSYTLGELGTVGDFFGGIMNPIVAIAAAFLTFLAFYVQYQANEDVRKQFKVQQFENQFFEMLRLHKENINEMNITGYYKSVEMTIEYSEADSEKRHVRTEKQVDKYISGRKVFVSMNIELIVCYEFLEYYSDLWSLRINTEHLMELAYQIFFFGCKSDIIKSKHIDKSIIENFKKELNKIRDVHKSSYGSKNKFVGKDSKEIKLYIKYLPFSGHENRLGHYYRHLFYMVKYIVDNEKKQLFNYERSREYLKLLRAQMANDEQLLLYYNYIIGFGGNWDYLGNNGNEFLTKYRMLHNLPISRLKYVENPKIHFKDFIQSIKKDNDPMFEWGDN